MSNTNPLSIDLTEALDEEIVQAACVIIVSASFAYAADGDVAGVVYYDHGADAYFAADLDELRTLIETHQDTNGVDSYSIWCGNSTAEAHGSSADALASQGWTA